MIRIECPHCKAEIQVLEHLAGTVTRCLSCGNEMTVPSLDTPAAPPAYEGAAPVSPGQPPGQIPLCGMAVTSLVFSVVGLLTSCILIGGVFGIVGIILGAMAMSRTGGATPSLRGRGLAVSGLSFGIASVVLMVGMAVPALILLPALGKARAMANQRVCATNLKQIGTALYTYSNSYDGEFPPQIGVLLREGSISTTTLECPASDSPDPDIRENVDPAAWANNHSDYVYIWSRRGVNVETSAVVAYERFGNHGDDGVNILFGDTSVRWHAYDDAEQILREQGIDPVYADY